MYIFIFIMTSYIKHKNKLENAAQGKYCPVRSIGLRAQLQTLRCDVLERADTAVTKLQISPVIVNGFRKIKTGVPLFWTTLTSVYVNHVYNQAAYDGARIGLLCIMLRIYPSVAEGCDLSTLQMQVKKSSIYSCHRCQFIARVIYTTLFTNNGREQKEATAIAK